MCQKNKKGMESKMTSPILGSKSSCPQLMEFYIVNVFRNLRSKSKRGLPLFISIKKPRLNGKNQDLCLVEETHLDT
jgi:hypothetical protein